MANQDLIFSIISNIYFPKIFWINVQKQKLFIKELLKILTFRKQTIGVINENSVKNENPYEVAHWLASSTPIKAATANDEYRLTTVTEINIITPNKFRIRYFDLNSFSTNVIGTPNTTAVIVDNRIDLIGSDYCEKSPLKAISRFSLIK